MIIRMNLTMAWKATKLIAQGNTQSRIQALSTPCKGKSVVLFQCFCPFRATLLYVIIPRAMPWANGSLPLWGVIGRLRIIILWIYWRSPLIILHFSLVIADLKVLHSSFFSSITLKRYFDCTKLPSPHCNSSEGSFDSRRALAWTITSPRQLVKSKGTL